MGFVIKEMYAFVSVGEDGDEGVMGFLGPNSNWVPMVGADMTRVTDLRKIADRITKVTCMKYRIKKFAYVGDIE